MFVVGVDGVVVLVSLISIVSKLNKGRFKKKIMEYSIKLARLVLEDPVFH